MSHGERRRRTGERRTGWLGVALTVTLTGALAVTLAVTLIGAPEPQAQLGAQELHSQIFGLRTWTHHVEIRLPFRDEDGNGHNDYDPQFALRVTHAGGSNPIGHGRCPATTMRARVGGSSELVATANERGLDSQCQLLTAFPDTIASGVAGVTLRRVAGAASQQTSSGSRTDTARATYTDGRTTFTADIAFAGFTPEQAGTTFELRYSHATGAAEREGCRLHRDASTERWRIDAHGTAVRQTTATLIDTLPPDGLVCGYHFSWPRIDGFVTPTPARPLVLASSAPLVGDYPVEVIADETVFSPSPILVAPFTDYDNDGAHDYAGAQITVTFTRKAGEPSGCSPGGEFIYRVLPRRLPGGHHGTSDGTKYFGPRARFRRVNLDDRLIHTPRNSEHHCSYDAAFATSDTTAPGEATHFVRKSDPQTDDDELAPDDTIVVATYENAAIRAPVTLEIRADSVASGETFTMVIEPVSGSDPSCGNRGMTSLVIGADGTQTFELDLVTYERGHTSPDDRCAYDLSWPDDEDGPATFHQRVGAATSRIDASVFDDPDSVVSQSYGVVQPTVRPRIEVTTVSLTKREETFTIGLAPNADAPPGCSERRDVRVVVPAYTAAGRTHVTLITQPVGESRRCTYDITWPPASDGTGRWLLDTSLDHLSDRIGLRPSFNLLAGTRYYPIFDGEIEIKTSSSVATDTTFTLPVASPNAVCSTVADVTVTIPANADAASVTLDDLIARAPEQRGPCAYEVAWPSNEDGVAPFAWQADDTHPQGASSSFDWNAPKAARSYRPSDALTFEPSVAVSVPQIDGPTPGVNLFAGTELTLTFARSPDSHPGCSLGTPLSTPHVVQPDGTTEGVHPTALIDVVAGTTEKCIYLFHVDSPVSSAPDAALGWSLSIDTVSATVQRESPRAQAVYTVGDITFTPEVELAVPQVTGTVDGAPTNLFADAPMRGDSHDALRFDVEFAAPAAPVGCTDTSGSTYPHELATDGTVSGPVPTLLAYVVGLEEHNHRLEQVATPCVYGVTFPAADANKGWLIKTPDASDDGEVAARERTAMATYTNAAVVSHLQVSVTTPVFSGQRSVSVTITADAGAHADCLVDPQVGSTAASSSATKMLTLDASGTTELPDEFRLTDVVADTTTADGRCAYDVVWSVTDLPLTQAIWTLADGDATWSNAGRVGATGSLSADYRAPAVEHFEATLNLVVVSHVPAATTFTVTVAPAGDAPPGCSPTTTRTLSAPALDGANDRTITDTFRLLHTPMTVVGHCSYAITWPDNEANGTSFVPDAAFTPDVTLSRDSATATNRYADADIDTTFTATLVASTTEAVTANTVFAVDVSPITGAGEPANCSTTSTESVTIAARSQSGSATVSLTLRPAGASAECSYALSWAPNEVSGTAWVQDMAFTPETALTPDAPRAANRYAPDVSYFVPSLSFAVRDVDFDGDGNHDYAGARFAVEFASTDDDCSDVTRAYELDASGRVAPVAPVRLIDEHAISTCTYAVTFPPTSSAVAAGFLVKQPSSTDVDEVSGADGVAGVTYAEAVSRFTANLYLGGTHTLEDEDAVNPIPAGTPFTVTVRPQGGAAAGCDADPTSEARHRTVTMRKAAVAERRPHTLLTITSLEGVVDRTANDSVCVYDVEWPSNEDGGTAFVIDTDPARPFSDTVRGGTADDVGAVVWYRARPTAGDQPGGGTPGDDMPGDVPGDVPGGDTLGDVPGGDAPGGDTPDDEAPADDTGDGPPRLRVPPLPRDVDPSGGWYLFGPSLSVVLSLRVPDVGPAAGGAVELHVTASDACGSDREMFSGVPASTGLVYALELTEGTVDDITAGAELRLPQFAERDGDIRECQVNVRLLSAPEACSLIRTQPPDIGTDALIFDPTAFSPPTPAADEPSHAFVGTVQLTCADPSATQNDASG